MKRQDALKSVIVLPALAAAMAATAEVAKAAKSSQAAMKYQPKPKGSQKCSSCRFFVAGKPATANGTCTIVDGAISPNGWCIAYAATK
jgi:hypothetical protein